MKNKIQKREPKNNSLKPDRPSVPTQQTNHIKPRPSKQTPIKPLSEPSSILSNPQLLSQILTTMRGKIIQEIRELHLDHFKKLSKRMSNMENLLVQIAKAETTIRGTHKEQKDEIRLFKCFTNFLQLVDY